MSEWNQLPVGCYLSARVVELWQPLHSVVPDLAYGGALVYLECVYNASLVTRLIPKWIDPYLPSPEWHVVF